MLRYLFAGMIFLVSFLSFPLQSSQSGVNLAEMATLWGGADSWGCVAALSPRVLQLRWVGAGGTGDSLKVALTLRESSIPIPQGCTLRLEAYLEMANVALEPLGTQNRALTTAATTFEWQVRPLDSGEFRGRLWLYLRPDDGARLPVYTYPLMLRVWAWLTPLRWLLRLLAVMLLVKLPTFKK